MPTSTYFVQECSTCGRNLQVRVEYLGKKVVCQHCGARFEAYDHSHSELQTDAGLSVLERADELIRQSGINLARAASSSRLDSANQMN
jgi:DNA-directed RNA polymerase subunit RPC12/RpoP